MDVLVSETMMQAYRTHPTPSEMLATQAVISSTSVLGSVKGYAISLEVG